MNTKQNLESLANAFLKHQNYEEMVEFLEAILTPKELAELSTRLEIVRMLKQDIPQHTIAERLGVGVATVTRGSKELQQGKFKNV